MVWGQELQVAGASKSKWKLLSLTPLGVFRLGAAQMKYFSVKISHLRGMAKAQDVKAAITRIRSKFTSYGISSSSETVEVKGIGQDMEH